jgi:hypothetical protein
MKSRWCIILVVVVIATIAVALNWRPLQIEYHKYALERLHEAIHATPTSTMGDLVGYGNGDQFKQQEEHCNRLVALGHFFHKCYEMENLPDTGDVHSAFWRLVQKEFPNRRYPLLSYPDNVLEVWDLALYESEWDAFVKRHNVPDFAKRFMTQDAPGKESLAPAPTGQVDLK